MNKRKIVERLISKDLIVSSQAYFKQVSILKSLIKLYPEELFWNNVSFDFEITSLFFFKTKKGANILSLKYRNYIQDQEKQDTFSFSWGEDKQIEKKPKNIKDFLNE